MSEELFRKYPHLKKVKERVFTNEGGVTLNPENVSYDEIQENGSKKNIIETFKTGGVGHKISKGEVVPTTKEGWLKLYDTDFEKAAKDAEKLVDTSKVNPEAYGIVVEMVFQMGYKGVSKFKKTLEHINKNEYKAASIEMLNSKWARQTTPRASRLSDIMKILK